jgi:hypothetical protein
MKPRSAQAPVLVWSASLPREAREKKIGGIQRA